MAVFVVLPPEYSIDLEVGRFNWRLNWLTQLVCQLVRQCLPPNPRQSVAHTRSPRQGDSQSVSLSASVALSLSFSRSLSIFLSLSFSFLSLCFCLCCLTLSLYLLSFSFSFLSVFLFLCHLTLLRYLSLLLFCFSLFLSLSVPLALCLSRTLSLFLSHPVGLSHIHTRVHVCLTNFRRLRSNSMRILLLGVFYVTYWFWPQHCSASKHYWGSTRPLGGSCINISKSKPKLILLACS